MNDRQALTRKYLQLWQRVQQLRDEAGLCAAVYTQITDVETECYGLLTYDRRLVKVDLEQSAAGLRRGQFPPEPQYKSLVATAEEDPVIWRYTTRAPSGDWAQPDFDASGWQEAPGGFGTPRTPNVKPRTVWKTDDIWIRREVTLPDLARRSLALRLNHGAAAEVYLNGVSAGNFPVCVRNYEVVDIAPAASAALRPGKNLIAIHCHQVRGGQYIDAGLGVLEIPAGK
jgi:hypothetical protein